MAKRASKAAKELLTVRVHPITPIAEMMADQPWTPNELGLRLPAEDEPVRRVYLSRPHNVETWPGCLDRAIAQWEAFARAVADAAEVVTTQDLGLPTEDAWIRDYGPVFLVSPERKLHVLDFHFTGWGDKYGPRPLDDTIPQQIAFHHDVAGWICDLVLEGGSLETDGRGTLLTTESCLLNANRGRRGGKTARRQLEGVLREWLCVDHIIWLPGGIQGDDTDGHVDDVARFVRPRVVAAVRAPADHPDHAALEANWEALGEACDAHGQKIERIALPAPAPRTWAFPGDRFGVAGVMPLPASYANFLVVNQQVFVPVFGDPMDEPALKVLEEAFPGRTITPIQADVLIVGLGGLHCLSLTEPFSLSP